MTPTTDTQNHPILDTSLEVVVQRDVTPLINQARASLPMSEIASAEACLCSGGFEIEDSEGEKTVLEYMRKSKGWEKKVTDFWKPKKQFWDKVHEACCAAEKDTAPEIGRIRLACDTIMKAWQKRKEAIARQKQAEIDASVEATRERQFQEARAAALRGDIAAAERLKQDSQELRAPVIMSTGTKLEGVSETKFFTATCVDVAALLKAVAAGHVSMQHEIAVRGKGMQTVPLFTVNPAVLAFYAAKLGTQFNWPGVKVEEDSRYSTRGI